MNLIAVLSPTSIALSPMRLLGMILALALALFSWPSTPAHAGASCDMSVSAAVITKDQRNLYLGITRGDILHVDLDTLAVRQIYNGLIGSYYSCIVNLQLISDETALFAETSADLGIVVNLETLHPTHFPHGDAWEFDVLGSFLDAQDSLWILGLHLGNPYNLGELISCRISSDLGAEFECWTWEEPSWQEYIEPIQARILSDQTVEIAIGRRLEEPRYAITWDLLSKTTHPSRTHEDITYLRVEPRQLTLLDEDVSRAPWCAEQTGQTLCAVNSEETPDELARFDPEIYLTEREIRRGSFAVADTIFGHDWQISLTAEGTLIHYEKFDSDSISSQIIPLVYKLSPHLPLSAYIGGEVEGPLPFASLSGAPQGLVFVGEGNGIVHLIDFQENRRRSLSCGYIDAPRDVCRVLYNGPLERGPSPSNQ